MSNPSVDTEFNHDILRPEEVAQYLRKSTSWVYKHWQELGGRKLGGSLLFPGKENLYEHLFSTRKGVEVRLHPAGNQAHEGLVQNKTSRKEGGNKEKGGDTKPPDTGIDPKDPDRHGLP